MIQSVIEEGEVRRMKKTILNNFALKLLSVVAALVLWLVVMNISDYTVTVEINDIPVEQLNGDVLEELDKIYDVAKGDTVDIVVKGRRSIVEGLTAQDFRATADLSTMSITNTVQIFVTPKRTSIADEISITCVDNTMSLNLEEKVSLQFSVKVKTTGTTPEEYAVCTAQTSPNIVVVEGPKSAVEKITDVMVSVDVSYLDESAEKEGNIKLYDAYGEEITNSRIVLSQDTVKVALGVYPKKEVPVEVEIQGTPKEGYGVAEVIYQPQTIQIAGEPNKIKYIDKIVIDDILVSGLDEDLETSVNISDYLPEDVYSAMSSDEVVITASIEKLTTKKLEIKASDINLIQKAQDKKYKITLSDDFYIEASGLDTAMQGVDGEAIKPSIMCGSFIIGDYNNVELQLAEIDGVTYDINGDIKVTVSYDNK